MLLSFYLFQEKINLIQIYFFVSLFPKWLPIKVCRNKSYQWHNAKGSMQVWESCLHYICLIKLSFCMSQHLVSQDGKHIVLDQIYFCYSTFSVRWKLLLDNMYELQICVGQLIPLKNRKLPMKNLNLRFGEDSLPSTLRKWNLMEI